MIYLDHSATTPLAAGVREEMLGAMETFGNPSSLHRAGLEAAELLRIARERVYAALGVPEYARIDAALPLGAGNPGGRRIFFTSSGTEADNLALFGTVYAKNYRKTPRIITTNSEHPAILSALTALADRRLCEPIFLSTRGGRIDPEEFDAALTPETLLVSIMTVNNETGAIYPVRELFARAKKKNPNVITHTDAVQGFGKLNRSFDRLGADLVTVSAHKIGGPKGVGALLVAGRLLTAHRIVPLIYGGGQEGGLRSGTENLIGIVGFGAACRHLESELPRFEEKMSALREELRRNLPEGCRINEAEQTAPHIVSLTLPSVRSETMLRYLSERSIAVSNGSACSSHKRQGNRVLEGFGLTADQADSTIRLSLGSENTPEQMRTVAKAIGDGCRELVHRSPF